jgi:phosphate transport system ATP-binding protein
LSAIQETGPELLVSSPLTAAGVTGGARLDAVKVSAWFGTNRVLSRVSLSMPPGTVTALIGPSGCGKSTFLRILNRMHEMVPSAKLAGQVNLNGQDIYAAGQRVTDTRKKIGMVFQKPNPFPTMSIAENVTAGLKLVGSKVSRSEREELVERSLTRAGLWTEVRDRLRDPGGALSGGQQQRLCIARSLAVDPFVLLMDEPCSALDPIATNKVEALIQHLKTRYTVVIVTHNLAQAVRVADLTAFFYLGKLVEIDRTDKIFQSPREKLTENYVTGRFG